MIFSHKKLSLEQSAVQSYASYVELVLSEALVYSW